MESRLSRLNDVIHIKAQTLTCCSIVCVPAIGADPRKTWARPAERLGEERLDIVLHDRLYPAAQVHLYDHLTQRERILSVKPPQGPNDPAHKKSAVDFASAEALVAAFRVAEWADRFLEIVQQHRRVQRTEQRPILFICHSTGGIVVKQALSKTAEGKSSIATCCLGVTFFSTPHHGSSVLSKPEYVQTVQNHLGLKWEMSESLRHDFLLRNLELEKLNHKFAFSVFGVKIYSYVESTDTNLGVLSTNEMGGETLTTIRLCIVDSRSGKLSSAEAPFEDEEVIQLNTTHIGAPRFMDENILYGLYVDEITAFVKAFSAEERDLHHALNNDIMNNTEVDVHQFYAVGTQGEPGSIKIYTAHPSLQTFLEIGPSKSLEEEEKARGVDRLDQTSRNGSARPAIEFRPASEPTAPTLTITTVENDETSSDNSRAESYPTPSTPLPGNVRTRRPSLITEAVDPRSPDHLAPQATKKVAFSNTANNDTEKARRPQRTHLFQLPSASSERFKWIHVPFTHTGWVPHVLTTISQDKKDPNLHTKLLMDKMWFSQHNTSRHASPHARFVRPSVKCLQPRNSERTHADTGITTPLSATDDVQFVVYLPYLHWDSFKNLQKRADVIGRRREQPHARPIAEQVAAGKSMEHKLIWQHLTSDRPVHCRRTLDQYGYPSLRNTSVRDGDQILFKRTKGDVDAQPLKDSSMKQKLRTHRSAASRQSSSLPVADDGAAKVLMVDQLWLWIVDNQTVITFFTPKEKEEDDAGLWREGDLRSEIYQDINGDYANQCADPFDFAALAVFHAIKALLDRTTDRDLQVFRIFEEYISILTEQQTRSFKEFRNNHQFKKAKDINAQQHIDNRKDLDALLELRDIEDELNTIDKLIKEQMTCVSEMLSQYQHLNVRGKGLNGTNFLADVNLFLVEHKEQIDAMMKTAQAAQRASKELLDMKQKQANIVEAHLAREQTEVAADQSRSVMIFTIFTIIFLPLSFFASVFGTIPSVMAHPARTTARLTDMQASMPESGAESKLSRLCTKYSLTWAPFPLL